jgi:hypothetical protein
MTKHLNLSQKFTWIVLMLSLLLGSFLLPHIVSAQVTGTISSGLDSAAQSAQYDTNLGLATYIGILIQVLLSATGIVFLILTVYAGILYMTATGDETKVKKAKNILATSIIGLLIIIGAYAITSFVMDQIIVATANA